MDTTELVLRRAQLCGKLRDLIQYEVEDFCIKTGVPISYIIVDISRLEEVGGQIHFVVRSVECRLSLEA
jgi:hypothetical protein